MNPVILTACLSPLVIIFIVMKLTVWMSGIYTEEKYVESESRKPHGPIWQMHMQTLTKRKRSMEIAQIIDDALHEYYSERGQDVPKWKQKSLNGG